MYMRSKRAIERQQLIADIENQLNPPANDIENQMHSITPPEFDIENQLPDIENQIPGIKSQSPDIENQLLKKTRSRSHSRSRSRSKSMSKSHKKQTPKKLSPERLRKTHHLITKTTLRRKLTTAPERMKTYLNVMCPSSGDCLGFGKERAMIKRYFDGFVSMKYAISPVKMIQSGANGFVNLVTYEHNQYKSYAILKNTIDAENSDNLFYEAMVGLNYINGLIPYFPCFLETYSALKHKSNKTVYNLKNGIEVDLPNIFTETNLLNVATYTQACKDANFNAVLIEYINNPVTFTDAITKISSKLPVPIIKYMINHLFMSNLYQIYAVLAVLENEYTHYDLHTSNVMLYTIPNNQCITMMYHYPDGTEVAFDTIYIVKLIDYGRNHCPYSKAYYNRICKFPNKCPQTCGDKSGHTFFDSALTNKNFYISTQFPNKSHDLRCVSIVSDMYNSSKIAPHVSPEARKLLDKVYYKGQYGTPPAEPQLGKIMNVRDMAYNLKEYLQNLPPVNINNKKAGTMHIYLDQSEPLVFIPDA